MIRKIISVMQELEQERIINFFKDINKLKVVKLQKEYNKKVMRGVIKC